MHVSRHFNTQALTETEKGKEWKSFACIVMPWMEDKEGAVGGRKCPSMVCVVESFTINSVDWRQFDIFIVRHISNTFQKQRASGNFQLLMHRGESVNFKRAEWRKRQKVAREICIYVAAVSGKLCGEQHASVLEIRFLWAMLTHIWDIFFWAMLTSSAI